MNKEATDLYKGITHSLMGQCNINNGDTLYQELCRAHQRGKADHLAALAEKERSVHEKYKAELIAQNDQLDRYEEQIAALQVEANKNMEELCEARGKVTPLIDKAADFIGCPDDLKSIACIDVALNHANKLREELREERERVRGLEEELEATQRELDRARGAKAALRKE
jgi:predicted RNase H-like nuclease (RuvC/YqgF family)